MVGDLSSKTMEVNEDRVAQGVTLEERPQPGEGWIGTLVLNPRALEQYRLD